MQMNIHSKFFFFGGVGRAVTFVQLYSLHLSYKKQQIKAQHEAT